jgi:chemotaxis signal transduction protein
MATLDDNQFLTFGIDGDVYAIPVGKVQEVLEYIKPVRLPKTAPYLKGLINIRGTAYLWWICVCASTCLKWKSPAIQP